jgi:hypothetical protein
MSDRRIRAVLDFVAPRLGSVCAAAVAQESVTHEGAIGFGGRAVARPGLGAGGG